MNAKEFYFPVLRFAALIAFLLTLNIIYSHVSAQEVTDTLILIEEEIPPVFTVVDEMPTYPGGDEARVKFVAEHLQYPTEAKKAGIQGTVFVSFVVDEVGQVTDVKILRGIGGGCDEEVVRVIQMMPRWNPGKQSGKPVRVQFNMPIKFTL